MEKIHEKFAMSSRLINKFMKIYATIGVDRQLRYKKGKFIEVKLGERAR